MMKRLLSIGLRAFPIVSVVLVFMLTAYLFVQGGMPRVQAWLFLVMLLIPSLGFLGLVWTGVSWLKRRRMDRLDWSALGVSVVSWRLFLRVLRPAPIPLLFLRAMAVPNC